MCANSAVEGQYFHQVIPVSFEMAPIYEAREGKVLCYHVKISLSYI